MRPVCFFAGVRGAGPCDGQLIRAHLVPRQLLKREFPYGASLGEHGWFALGRSQAWYHGLTVVRVDELVADPRSWVPCCGGPMGNAGHHGMLDVSKRLRIARADLPAAVEEFAAELGLGWWLDREYGEAVAAA